MQGETVRAGCILVFPGKKYDQGGGRMFPYTAFGSESIKELF